MIGRKTVSQCVSEDYCKGWNDAVDAMPKWISVKAGLPKAYRNVDIVFGSHDSIGYYSPISKRWYDSHNIQIDGVTHWKYRDEPPKEDAHGPETGEKHEAQEMADEGPGEAGTEPV